jgi:hypothetical protein
VPTYTAPIAYNADATTIKNAIEAILGVGTVSDVLNSPDQQAANQVPFWDEINVREVALMNGFIVLFTSSYIYNGYTVVDSGALTGGGPIAYVDRVQSAAAAVDAVQEVTLTGGSPSGVWGLVADFGAGDETTSNLAATANAAAVQAALEALATPTPGDVVVTGNAGGPYTVTFQAALGGQAIDQMQPKAGSAGNSNFGMTFATQFANAPAAGAVATLAHILDAEIVVEWST